MDESPYSAAALARNPWVYIRLGLGLVAVLAGFFMPLPIQDEPQFGYRTAFLFAIPFLTMFLPLLGAYWAARSTSGDGPTWQQPGWTTDPLRARGPHHLLHLAGMILYAAGVGMLVSLWRIMEQFDSLQMTMPVVVSATVFLTGQAVKFGIAIAQGVFAKHYAPDAYSITTKAIPERGNRAAAILWIGVLLVPLGFVVGFFAFVYL